ncbi:MAG: lantibiotic leader peptide-processing serine protease [Solirubrobacteraceae bacterium]|jgi:subtilisin family serine protease|nr:lantibiotic leader peptide-processing serine protease [Solirubrobacteraceae bacterium]
MGRFSRCAGALAGLAFLAGAPAAAADGGGEYVVVYEQGSSITAARQAVRAAGGTIVSENTDVGVATVRSGDARFVARADREGALYGAADNRPVGRAPDAKAKRSWRDVETERGTPTSGGGDHLPPVSGDPLAGLQWDMQLIGATPSGSYARQQGNHGVRVGIIDTGVDGNHPDIAPNFDRALSRNFTVDNPQVGIDDGPCEHPSCVDPADEDDDGHGTHVAGTIGGALNGLGMAGVAPRVDLINVRAGQDSGFFLIQPTVDALTYAAKIGIDVVNMSFFIDPWLFNCTDNPADSPAEQAQQRAIIEATQRAVDFAHKRGVTLIAAEGNEATNLDRPTIDSTSPDFPADAARERNVDNSCLSMPSEAPNVLDVSSVGPINLASSPYPRKAYYSNYGLEQTVVAAPGGDRREFFGTPQFNAPENRILAPYPLNVARACGEVDADGVPNGLTTCPAPATRFPPLVRNCAQGTCALYQWIQGTSMAAPHAVGVAAIIVAQRGQRDGSRGGLTLAPDRVERILRRTATDTPCPSQEPFTYPDPDLGAAFDALCEGTPAFNGFYGDGIVNALAASRGGGD